MTRMIASGANQADDPVFYSVPSEVAPGTKVTVYYDRSRTILKCAIASSSTLPSCDLHCSVDSLSGGSHLLRSCIKKLRGDEQNSGHNVVMHVGFNDWSKDKDLEVEPIPMEPAAERAEKTPEANATIAAVWMDVMEMEDSITVPDVSKENMEDADLLKAEVRSLSNIKRLMGSTGFKQK
jgi:hypothetical protein